MVRSHDDEPRLSLPDFRVLCTLVAAASGIALGNDQRPSTERKLRERLIALGLDTFADYIPLLRADTNAREELGIAIDLLATHETYFFREDYQLRAFRDEVLPMIVAQNQSRKRLTVWSAGCSTGEEAYSIAINLLEASGLDGWELRVFGSDISRACLQHARRGHYTHSAFRATSQERRKRWFVEQNNTFAIDRRVRELCHFGHLNLLDQERVRAVGRVDAIFCRNVLIYLGERIRRQIIDSFHERLHPGGVLFLGHSESLLNVTTAFELLHLRNDLVYRKPQPVSTSVIPSSLPPNSSTPPELDDRPSLKVALQSIGRRGAP